MDTTTTTQACPKCGKPIDPGQRFCPSCGCDVESLAAIDPGLKQELTGRGFRLRQDVPCRKCGKSPVFSKTEAFQTEDAKVSTFSCNPIFWLLKLVFLPLELLIKAIFPRQERTWNKEVFVCPSCKGTWDTGVEQVAKRTV